MTQPPPSPLASPEPWDLVAPAYTNEVVPMFERYAAEALRLAAPAPDAAVVDVACGPGTLSLLAARQVRRVAALDFAPAMIEHLRARVAAAKLTNVEATVGDGQALPYGDGEFDAGFSMFGLMFFPDRVRGLAELHRVLRRGGVAVVSSWLPMDQVPMMATFFAAIREEMPNLPFGQGPAPLGDEAAIRQEFGAAGFSVDIHQVTYAMEHPTVAESWAAAARTMAPLVLLQKKLGDGWRPIGERIQRRLEEKMGSGPVSIPMPAYLSVGRK